jgi:hypothetical protein
MERKDPSLLLLVRPWSKGRRRRTHCVIPKIAFISHSVIEEIKLKGNNAELTKGSGLRVLLQKPN